MARSGQTILWVNGDTISHTVTSNSHENGLSKDSGIQFDSTACTLSKDLCIYSSYKNDKAIHIVNNITRLGSSIFINTFASKTIFYYIFYMIYYTTFNDRFYMVCFQSVLNGI